MLSCDCSSISRPCSVRRRSLISVLDVWMDSVLMATSLVRVADWREIHRHLLGERESLRVITVCSVCPGVANPLVSRVGGGLRACCVDGKTL